MKRTQLTTVVFCLATLLILAPRVASAQTEDPFGPNPPAVINPAPEDATPAEPATVAEPKKARNYKGRLPNYYPAVVSAEQRKAIYAIQMEYYEKLRALREQMEAMTKERNTRIEAVLSADQLKEVQQLAAEAKAKREKTTQ